MSVEGSRHRNGSKIIDFRGIFTGLMLKYSRILIAHPKLSSHASVPRASRVIQGSGWAAALQREPLPQPRVLVPAGDRPGAERGGEGWRTAVRPGTGVGYPPSTTPTRQVWLEAWGQPLAQASPGEPRAPPSRLKGPDTRACLGESPCSGGPGPGLGGASLRMKRHRRSCRPGFLSPRHLASEGLFPALFRGPPGALGFRRPL